MHPKAKFTDFPRIAVAQQFISDAEEYGIREPGAHIVIPEMLEAIVKGRCDTEYQALLKHVIKSDYINDGILRTMHANAQSALQYARDYAHFTEARNPHKKQTLDNMLADDKRYPFIVPNFEERRAAKKEFDKAYRVMEEKTYAAAQKIFTLFIGPQPQITLNREGTLFMSDADPSHREWHAIATDYTGKWQEIVQLSDEELAFSEDLSIEHPLLLTFRPEKSRLMFTPQGEAVYEDIAHIGVRLKAKHKAGHKINDSFFGLNVFKDKAKGIPGITDFGGSRIVLKSGADCYKALETISNTPELEIVSGSFKDYIENPKKNGYQSLHFLINIDNHYIEVQIRDEDMHEHAEHNKAVKHDGAFKLEQNLRRAAMNILTKGRLARNALIAGEFMQRKTGVIWR